MERLLIRGDNWRYRAHIAEYGRYPDVSDYRYLKAHDNAAFRKAASRDWESESSMGAPLPDTGSFGYELAYLVVMGDSVALTRGEWGAGDETLCATCAESERPEVGAEWALYPLFQGNGEITGNQDCRVVRCDHCQDIIHDYETLTLEWCAGTDEPEHRRFYASDHDGAMAEAAELVETLERGESDFWYVRVMDAERHLDEPVTGQYWPVETAFYRDSRLSALARLIDAGQSILPGFDMPQTDWEPADFDAMQSAYSRECASVRDWPEPESIGSPSYVPPFAVDSYGAVM